MDNEPKAGVLFSWHWDKCIWVARLSNVHAEIVIWWVTGLTCVSGDNLHSICQCGQACD